MKHALALLLLSCVLVAQDKPAAQAPKPAAVEKPEESKPKIPPINVRDELIELIHQLKKEAGGRIDSPLTIVKDPAYQAVLATKYEASRRPKPKPSACCSKPLLNWLNCLWIAPSNFTARTGASGMAGRN